MKSDQSRAVVKADSEKNVTQDFEISTVTETNSAIFIYDECTPAGHCISVESLLDRQYSFNGKSARALKDNGCNTNVACMSFASKIRDKVKIVKRNVFVKHSNKHKHTIEKSPEFILGKEVKIVSHVYKSN